MSANLLPRNSTSWERALANGIAFNAQLRAVMPEIQRAKWVIRPVTFLPYLVYELGLGELTPYVPNLYQVLDEGVDWQRVRGTPDAIRIGLSWVGYSASLEEAWTGRTWWNAYQLRFNDLPAQDNPDLEQIEGITTLSVPKRSQLRRGVHHYDANAMELERGQLDESLLDQESGIAITAAGTLWSFGRETQIMHTLTEAEGLAIGNWLPPVEETELLWKDMMYPWVSANFLWAASPAAQRRALLAGWFSGRTLYVAFKDALNGVIGYRRCRAVRAVKTAIEGAYAFADARYNPSISGERLYIEALSDFNDAADVEASSIALAVHVTLAPSVPAGKLWLAPEDVLSSTEIAITTLSLPLRATVREQIKLLMRF